MKTRSLWIVVILWGAVLLSVASGIFCLLSPIWFEGGIVGLLQSQHAQDSGVRFLEMIFNSIGSILLGIVIFAVSVFAAIFMGIAATIVAATGASSRTPHPLKSPLTSAPDMDTEVVPLPRDPGPPRDVGPFLDVDPDGQRREGFSQSGCPQKP